MRRPTAKSLARLAATLGLLLFDGAPSEHSPAASRPAISVYAADIAKIVPPKIVARGKSQRPVDVLSHLNTASHAKFPISVLMAGQAPADREGCASRYAAGQIELAPAVAGTETIVLVISPRQEAGDVFRPVAIEQDGMHLTLVCEHWTHYRFERLGSVHSVYAVSLGRLPAGEYTLHYELHEYSRRDEANYRRRRVTSADVPLPVRRHPPETPATLGWKGLVSKPVTNPAFYQAPYPTYLWSDDRLDQVAGALRAGHFDLGIWLANRKGVRTIPDLAPPVFKKPAYVAILGPPIAVGGHVLLREIEWRDRHAIVRVELWQSTDAPPNAEHARPLVVESLAPEFARSQMPAGEYRIDLEWTLFLGSKASGEPYRQSTPAEIAADSRASALERQFLAYVEQAGSKLRFEIAGR